MLTEFLGIDWDDGNREKCQKHGVSIQEIEEMLVGQPAIRLDAAHSQGEDRFLAIGLTAKRRHVFVAFAVRVFGDDRYLRPISARYMHRKEIEQYEEARS